MFNIDILNNLESLSIYLAKPSGELLYPIDEYIDKSNTSMPIGLNQRYELSFNITCSDIDNNNSWYELLQEGMYLFVEKIGLFRMNQPKETYNGIKGIKSITAYSCDIELDDKSFELEFNMGTSTSQEYLVEYEDDETENILNPYTGIPYDWIVLYNTFPEQLSELQNKYDSGFYGPKNSNGDVVIMDDDLIAEIDSIITIIPRLKNKINSSTDDNGITEYTLSEYIIYEYANNEENAISSITLTSLFENRIEELITFYTKYRKQLSLLSIILEKTDGNWTVGNIYGINDGDYSIANKKCQFDSEQTLYSFLTQDLAQSINCVIDFDLLNRKVNVTPVEEIGEDTGIVLSYDNLLNELSISSSEDNLCTRLYVTGANDLNIEQVNFGLPYIDDITYKLNARDSNGNRIYVSDELAEKYMQYIDYRESLRAAYIQNSKDYNNYASQISEIQYRVPNDSLKTDWGTYTLEELEASLTTYKNLLAALISLYKEDYGTAGLNDDGSVNENYIKSTMYWYDYAAYNSTIKEIECAISTYPYYSDQDKWTNEMLTLYKDVVNAWETDWTLYGTIELKAKIDSYIANMDILAESSVIRVSPSSYEIKTWNELTDDEKTEFGNLSINYYYDTYIEYYNNMVSAQEYLNILLDQVSELEELQNKAQTDRLEIVSAVKLQSYFTEEECKLINRLYRDSYYTNENILTTSLNNTVDSIDVMYELLEDGQNQLSILSRPQLTFSISSDNLLGLSEFKSLWNSFMPGNYMLVQYKDDIYIKLRMIGYTFNPLLPSSKNLDITFSNYIRSKHSVSDIENILGLASGSTVSSSSGGSGNSGGTYGESDDIDVTISNTMLAKLLNTEMFGTRVANVILDTIDVNAITAKYATFNGLSKGTTTIDGSCLTTGYIKSINYNGTYNSDENTYLIDNTEGSILSLYDGTFSLAGGKIVYDGTKLTFSSDVTLSWDQITDKGEFVTSADIPTKVSELLNDSGYQNASQVTTITQNTITTSYVNALAVTAKAVASDWVYAGKIEAEQITVGLGGNLYATGYDTFEQITDSILYYNKSSAATASVTTETAYYGTKCLKIVATGNDAYVYLGHSSTGYGCVPVYAGKTYLASCYVKSSSSSSVQMYIVGHTAKNNVNSAHTGNVATVGTSWTRISRVYTATSEYPYISLRIDNDSAGTTIYVDALQIEEVSSTSQAPGAFQAAGMTIIDGGNLITNSIAANKIDVTDLFAQDITATGTIRGVSLVGATGSFSGSVTTGQLTATGGTIGGWNIGSSYIDNTNSSGNYVYIGNGTNSNQDVLVVRTGSGTTASPYAYPFILRADGYFAATNAKITGEIMATSITAIESVYITSSGTIPTAISANDFGLVLNGDAGGNQIGGGVYSYGRFTNYGSIIAATDEYAFRAVYGDYGFIIKNDGDATYFSITENGSPYGLDNGSRPFYIKNSTGFVTINNLVIPVITNAVRPKEDSLYQCGSSEYRFTKIYGTDGTVSTSDERDKNIIGSIDDRYKSLYMSLEAIAYRWKNTSINNKIHLGLGAQTTEQKAISCGISIDEIGMIDHDYWDTPSEDGRTDRYGMSYQEISVLTIPIVQEHERKIKSLEKEIKLLKERILV